MGTTETALSDSSWKGSVRVCGWLGLPHLEHRSRGGHGGWDGERDTIPSPCSHAQLRSRTH